MAKKTLFRICFFNNIVFKYYYLVELTRSKWVESKKWKIKHVKYSQRFNDLNNCFVIILSFGNFVLAFVENSLFLMLLKCSCSCHVNIIIIILHIYSSMVGLMFASDCSIDWIVEWNGVFDVLTPVKVKTAFDSLAFSHSPNSQFQFTKNFQLANTARENISLQRTLPEKTSWWKSHFPKDQMF